MSKSYLAYSLIRVKRFEAHYTVQNVGFYWNYDKTQQNLQQSRKHEMLSGHNLKPDLLDLWPIYSFCLASFQFITRKSLIWSLLENPALNRVVSYEIWRIKSDYNFPPLFRLFNTLSSWKITDKLIKFYHHSASFHRSIFLQKQKDTICS